MRGNLKKAEAHYESNTGSSHGDQVINIVMAQADSDGQLHCIMGCFFWEGGDKGN